MTREILSHLSELGVATLYEASGREGLIDFPLIQLLTRHPCGRTRSHRLMRTR